MARNDEVDWGDLMMFGSIIGNIIQADRNIAAKDEIQQKQFQLNQLLNDREALIANLKRFQNAVHSLEQKVKELEKINSELLQANNQLEAEKNTLAVEYNEKLSKLQKGGS